MSLAEQRAQMYTDLLQVCWSTLRPGTFTEDDAAYITDKLITKGWRTDVDNLEQARDAVRRGIAAMEAGVRGEAVDPVDPVEQLEPDYRCPQCRTTNPRAHKLDCTVGRRQ